MFSFDTLINLLFLPLLFFIGLVTTYQDFKIGKVRNKWILLGTSWGIGILFLLFLWHFVSPFFTDFNISLSYLFKTLLNISVGALISFLMWKFNVWAAGDAKLFIVFVILLPLTFYAKSYFVYFPSFVLLINIFIPIFLYLLFSSLIYYFKFIFSNFNQFKKKKKFSQAEKKEKRKQRLKSVKNSLKIIFLFVGLFLCLNLFQDKIQRYTFLRPIDLQVFSFAGLIVFSNKLMNLFEKKPRVFYYLAFFIGLVLIYGFVTSYFSTLSIILSVLKVMVIFIAVLTIFIQLIDFHILKTDIKEVEIKNLKPRMTLAESTINYLKQDPKYFENKIGHFFIGGLSSEQVKAIKKWFLKRGEELKKIKIYKPFPFVVWMFIGLLITFVLKGSLFHLVWQKIF